MTIAKLQHGTAWNTNYQNRSTLFYYPWIQNALKYIASLLVKASARIQSIPEPTLLGTHVIWSIQKCFILGTGMHWSTIAKLPAGWRFTNEPTLYEI